MPATDHRQPPVWARAADLVCLALLALAAFVLAAGGIRIRTGLLRLSLTSPSRLLIVAAAIGLVRHIVARGDPIHRDLPRRLSACARAVLRDDVGQQPGAPTSSSFVLGLVVLFAALTAVMTYPLVWRMHDAVYDPGDPLLNVWTLSWIAHELPSTPRHLFDGNIFAPEPNTLAYSETLLAPAILVAPLVWIGLNGILVHNLVFVAGFILSGVGTALLVRDLTGHAVAAIAAGIMFAFLPFRFDHFAQVQLQQAQWIPLALWAFHRVLWNRRWRDGTWLGVFVAAQLLSCMYYGMFLAVYLLFAGGWLLLWRLGHWRSWLPILSASIVVALLLFAPAAKAYFAAREVVGERGRQENVAFSATWTNYLAAPDTNRLYGRTAERFGALERNLFPGLTVLVLAAVALCPPWSAVRAAYAIGLVLAVDLTLGFNGVTYRLLYDHVAPFRALRIPALAVVLVGFSLAVLAGYGVARLTDRVGSGRARAVIVGVLAVFVLAEDLSTPMSLTTIPTTPPEVYADLIRDNAGRPASTILELPMIHERDSRYQDQIYMYYSTFHWQKLINGYSGFFPLSYLTLAAAMREFPDARSVEMLRQRGARYLLIHGERLSADVYERTIRAVDACGCGLTAIARRPWEGREISLYRVE